MIEIQIIVLFGGLYLLGAWIRFLTITFDHGPGEGFVHALLWPLFLAIFLIKKVPEEIKKEWNK